MCCSMEPLHILVTAAPGVSGYEEAKKYALLSITSSALPC